MARATSRRSARGLHRPGFANQVRDSSGTSGALQDYTYDDFGNPAAIGKGTAPSQTTTTPDRPLEQPLQRRRRLAYDNRSLTNFKAAVLVDLPATRDRQHGNQTWTHTYDAAEVWSWRTVPATAPLIDTFALRGEDGKGPATKSTYGSLRPGDVHLGRLCVPGGPAS